MAKKASLLKSPSKLLMYGVGGWLCFSIVRKLVKSSLAFIGIKTDDSEDEKKLLDGINYNSNNLSKPDFYYRNLCSQMQARMSEIVFLGFPFTDELEKLNTDDLKYLVEVFGIRDREGVGLGIGSYSGNLFRWFEEEFGGFMSYSIYSNLKEIFEPTELW